MRIIAIIAAWIASNILTILDPTSSRQSTSGLENIISSNVPLKSNFRARRVISTCCCSGLMPCTSWLDSISSISSSSDSISFSFLLSGMPTTAGGDGDISNALLVSTSSITASGLCKSTCRYKEIVVDLAYTQ